MPICAGCKEELQERALQIQSKHLFISVIVLTTVCAIEISCSEA